MDKNKKLQTRFIIHLKLRKGEQKCTVEKELIVRLSMTTNRVLPISISAELSVKIPDNALSPIVNPFSKRVADSSINLWRNCGPDNICNSTLTLRAKTNIASLADRGETALTKLIIDAPNIIEIDSILVVRPELSYGYVLKTNDRLHVLFNTLIS